MSKYERTGWRDEKISRRHRCFGEQLHLMDIDGIWVETNGNIPRTIVEYKHEKAEKVTKEHWQIQVLTNLGDMAHLPAFVIRYADDFSWYIVTPVNKYANKYLTKSTRLTEIDFVKFLYVLRDLVAPDENTIIGNIGYELVAQGINNAP